TAAVRAHFAAAAPAEAEAQAQANANADANVVTAPAMPDCLPRLLQLLAEGDSDAIDLWQEHEGQFNAALAPQTALRVGAALQNFEFDAAHALLAGVPAAAAQA
ncbi:MAG: hypothetical protein H7Z39_06530, partial [Burkholderiaceae bacterium]|nr:hypothetical protein [Burkholderiaceae bacterium]